MIKWKDMTPKQLERVSQDLSDHAHDMGIDREQMVVARRLDREARRRERKASLGLMEEVIIEGHGWTVHVRYDAERVKWSHELFLWPVAEPAQSATSSTLTGMFFTLLAHYHVKVAPALLDEALPDLLKLRRDAQKRRVEQVKASLQERVAGEAAKVVPGIVPTEQTPSATTFSDDVMRAMGDARAKDWIRESAPADFVGDDTTPNESPIYVGPNGCNACGNAPGERHAVKCEGAS